MTSELGVSIIQLPVVRFSLKGKSKARRIGRLSPRGAMESWYNYRASV